MRPIPFSLYPFSPQHFFQVHRNLASINMHRNTKQHPRLYTPPSRTCLLLFFFNFYAKNEEKGFKGLLRLKIYAICDTLCDPFKKRENTVINWDTRLLTTFGNDN